MRVAVASGEQLFLDSLVSLLAGNRFQVVAADTNYRDCVRLARDRVDLFVFDLRGASDNDIQFFLGAQTFSEFRLLGITDANHPLPDGFQAGVDRTESTQSLIEKAQLLTADVGRTRTRRAGRPRTVINGLELSPREFEVARLIARGYTNQRIATEMAVGAQSVKNLVSRVIRRLECENRVQVALRLSSWLPA